MTLIQAVQILGTAAFVVLWFIIGVADWKRQRIKSEYLRRAVYVAAAGYLVFLGLTVAGRMGQVATYHTWDFYRECLINVAFCTAAALSLWRLGVWPAGDAKLFIVLAALYPIMTGPQRMKHVFFSALINTFIPASLALFARALGHVGRTRLRHQSAFLAELGWIKGLSFFRGESAQLWAGGLAALKALPATLLARWKPLAWQSLTWIISMAAMAVFSYYARRALRSDYASPIRLVLLWTVVFLVWQRAVRYFGARWVNAATLAAGVAVVLRWPPGHWGEVWFIFEDVSVFCVFLSLGVSLAMGLLSGRLGYALAFVLPLFIGLAGFVMSWAWQGLHVAYAGIVGSSLALLAFMGLFFGLCLVMVRLWDDELRPYVLADRVHPFLVLAPRFLDELRQDGDFFSEHFGTVYPDGLTEDQSDAVKGWCAGRGVDKIPLVPTVSFSAWIFLGFFLTRLLGGASIIERFL